MVLDVVRLIHLSSFGLLTASVIGGWVLVRNLSRTGDQSSQALLLNAFRPLGLLSPVAIVMLLGSGISMMIIYGLSPMNQAWLLLKILFFCVTATLGILGGGLARKRSAIFASVGADALSGEDAERVKALNARLHRFLVIQTILLLSIVLLSIIKPGN